MKRFAFAVAGCARARVCIFIFFFHQFDPILIEGLQQVTTVKRPIRVYLFQAPQRRRFFNRSVLKQAEPRLNKGLPLVAE